jgi:hypothetical protein
MTPTDRDAARAAGAREALSGDLCNACYKAQRREETRSTPSTDPRRRCTRCGVSGALAHLRICQDCADVTTDLREVGLWTAELVPA